jgi:hypothetical protein
MDKNFEINKKKDMLFIRRQQLKELLDNENNELQYEIYSNLNSSNFNNYLPNNQVNNNNYIKFIKKIFII